MIAFSATFTSTWPMTLLCLQVELSAQLATQCRDTEATEVCEIRVGHCKGIFLRCTGTHWLHISRNASATVLYIIARVCASTRLCFHVLYTTVVPSNQQNQQSCDVKGRRNDTTLVLIVYEIFNTMCDWLTCSVFHTHLDSFDIRKNSNKLR